MKVFFNILLSIISIVILFLIFVNIYVRDVSIYTINDDYTKGEISNYLMDYVELDFPDLDDTKCLKIEKELKENKNMLKISKKYYKKLIPDLLYQTKSNVNIENEINSIINEVLLDNLNMTNAQTRYIKKQMKSGYLTTLYPKLLNRVNKSMNNKKRKILSVYNFFTSDLTTFVLTIVLIILCLIIIGINGLITAFKNFSLIFIITGFIIIVSTYFLNKYLSVNITNYLVDKNLDISIMPFNLAGLLSIIIGVFLFGTYIIFKTEK